MIVASDQCDQIGRVLRERVAQILGNFLDYFEYATF